MSEEEEEEEENVEDAEDIDEVETEDEEMFDEASINNRSTYSNTTSVSTSLNESDQRFCPRQEFPIHPPPVEDRIRQQMTTNWPAHPQIGLTVVDFQTNSVYPSS